MLDKNLLIGVSLVLVWSCFDLRRSYLNISSTESRSRLTDDNSQNIHEEISIPKLKTSKMSTIKIRYCHSCGYRNVFEQFSQLVRINYPNMAIIEENDSPGPIKSLLARVLSIIKMALLICLLFGQNPFPLLNIPTPRVYSWALQNKMYACLIIFFLSNSLESYLISTGAFEISVDNVPLWSKLETGRIPSANEFIQMLQPFGNNPNKNIQI
jgi:selT/selW/selH-like putative selenoprotein